MTTKSFQTDFRFTKKNGHALANALEHSKRVNIQVSKPVNRYDRVEDTKIHQKFDTFFKV